MTSQLANAANLPSDQGDAPGGTEALQPCRVPVSPPDETAWDEAFLRVESYLRAHQVESRVRLNQLATDIIREAREEARTRPGEAPVTTAMQVTHTRIGKWFAEAGQRGDWSDERVRVRGRLALLLTHTAALPADSFLGAEPPPPRVAAALASGVLRPGPEIRFTNMPAAPLAFGFDDPGSPKSARQSWREAMRASMVWVSIVAIYGVAWAASH